MERLGVLFVSSPERPGADTRIHALLMRHLDRAGFEVHVACPAGSAGARTQAFETLADIPQLRIRPTNFGHEISRRGWRNLALLPFRLLPVLASLAGLVWYVRRHRIRVLHSTDRAREALPCVVVAKLSGAKSIVHAHVAYGRWMSPAARWSLARADALVGISDFVARSLIRNGCPSRKTHVILNAIDAAAWDPCLDPAQARRQLGLADAEPVVTCVARLFLWKGQAELMRALPIVRREFPRVRLVIVGDDDRSANPGGESFAARLRLMATELDLQENVVFTGPRGDVATVLAASDVFAMPSFEEPFGLVFLEAMAMKRPVVALESGGTPEVVEHGKAGLLCPAGDTAAIAESLLTLLRDPALRRRMGEYGRTQVVTRFAPDRLAGDAERLYRALSQQ